jgi:NAD(P)H-flavin reductase
VTARARRLLVSAYGAVLLAPLALIAGVMKAGAQSRPEEGWRGERGRIDPSLLRRYALPDPAGWSALVCGPSAMVAEAASALKRLGMPPAAIQVEGF